MTDDDTFELSRRKALAGLGTIGVASAGAGMGTSAFFSDTEEFNGNSLTAGQLDLRVGYEEHYSDWSPDEEEHAGMADTQDTADIYLPALIDGADDILIDIDDGEQDAFLEDTLVERNYEPETISEPCDLPDGSSEERPSINIEDVKPGDFGEVTFSLALCDNPGYLWMNGELIADDENSVVEPEADDDDENNDYAPDADIDGDGELAEQLHILIWDDTDCDNIPDTDAVGGTEDVLLNTTLRDAMENELDYVPSDGDWGFQLSADCFDANTEACIGFAWYLPVDHANELQTDSVEFDLGFYTEQCRHNDGSGQPAES